MYARTQDNGGVFNENFLFFDFTMPASYVAGTPFTVYVQTRISGSGNENTSGCFLTGQGVQLNGGVATTPPVVAAGSLGNQTLQPGVEKLLYLTRWIPNPVFMDRQFVTRMLSYVALTIPGLNQGTDSSNGNGTNIGGDLVVDGTDIGQLAGAGYWNDNPANGEEVGWPFQFGAPIGVNPGETGIAAGTRMLSPGSRLSIYIFADLNASPGSVYITINNIFVVAGTEEISVPLTSCFSGWGTANQLSGLGPPDPANNTTPQALLTIPDNPKFLASTLGPQQFFLANPLTYSPSLVPLSPPYWACMFCREFRPYG